MEWVSVGLGFLFGAGCVQLGWAIWLRMSNRRLDEVCRHFDERMTSLVKEIVDE